MPTKSHTLSSSDRKHLNSSDYAFPNQRKEPIENASHVRNAVARFDQVKGVSDDDRKKAFRRIKAAARKMGIHIPETHWQQLGNHPQTAR
ncbi:MAG: DUF6582 domain-containing protein [Acidobacteriaceae bacterium]